jgi:hypothetical protein
MKAQEFDGSMVQLATRIPKALHVRVRVDAIDKGHTMAEWVSTALREHLDRCQGKKRPAKGAKSAAGSAPSAA